MKAGWIPTWLQEWERENKCMAPVYEMKCPACGCKFEVRQGYNDKALVRCPKCRTTAKRLIPEEVRDGKGISRELL